LGKSILADSVCKLVFREGKDFDLYLVGGNLRDILLKRKSTDWDFVVDGEPSTLAANIASCIGGKTIMIGDDRRLCRVVLPDRSSIDFSKLKDGIDADLRQRDFTINSLGWSAQKGIIDPNGGLRDLRLGLIRMTSSDNLGNDPVRIVRAYRFAAELGFVIEPRTRGALKELSSLVATEKYERITSEFFKIMNVRAAWRILKMMCEDEVLERIILRSAAELHACLKAVSSFEEILDVIPLRYKVRLNHRHSQNITYEGLLRLESLLRANPPVRLALSAKILKNLRLIEKGDAFRRSAEEGGASLVDILFDLLELLDGAAEDYLMISRLPGQLRLFRKYRHIVRKGLLSTAEICSLTGLQEGVSLGKVIRALRKAQFYRDIKDREDARKVVSGMKLYG
jgi:tRNA nucleotidyltransferase/poly(A) polymerase